MGLAGLAVLAVSACGGDDDGGNATPLPGTTQATGSVTPRATSSVPTPVRTPSTGGSADTSQPLLQGPASRWAPGELDLGNTHRASVPDTYPINVEIFQVGGPFLSPGEAQEMTKLWGFVEGATVTLEPAGLLSSVPRGGYYITIDSILFSTPEGAEKAFLGYQKFYQNGRGSEPQTAKPLGNQSAAFKIQQGKVGSTGLDAVYHSFLFRRGNLVGIVRTYGAVAFMTVDAAREVAVIMDSRATGERQAPIPTPGGALPNTPVGGVRP